MSYDYTALFKEINRENLNTWQSVYDDNLSLPDNFLSILKRSVYLPYDRYKLITAYAFIPSALARTVPYLFLYGMSGSGKSTIAKLIAHLHGIDLSSSSDTFAGIRNSLEQRRRRWIDIPSSDPDSQLTCNREIEVNTCMVWDDIDSKVFTNNRDLYRLFKFGYDKSSDKIEVSSLEIGKNLIFHCFCPKTFSSIQPLHLDGDLKELRRRLIVIPTKTIEDLSETRLLDLGIDRANWANNLIDVSHLNWDGFSDLFKNFWDIDLARLYLTSRGFLLKNLNGLNSKQRAISIDLITTGVTIGIWNNEIEAIKDVTSYWQWLSQEFKTGSEPLYVLLKQYIANEVKNALNNGCEPMIKNAHIRNCCEHWHQQGQLLERATAKTIKYTMNELGYRLIVGGQWTKS